jgi:uncharacterized membrane protein
MKQYLTRSLLVVACLSFVAVPLPSHAQSSSDMAMGVRTNTSTISAGGSVGVFAWVQNTSSARMRATSWFTSLSPCGTETMLSGYSKFALNAGQSVQVTVGYPIPPDACPGTYAVTFHVKSGGKNSAESSTTCYLEVK